MKRKLFYSSLTTIFFTGLVIHFIIIAFCFFPESPVLKAHNRFLPSYFKYFSQNWQMFSPPPSFNLNLSAQYIFHHGAQNDTSGFYDITTPLKENQWEKRHSGLLRLNSYVYNCCRDYMSADAYLWSIIAKDSTLMKDSAAAKNFYLLNITNATANRRLVKYSNYALDKVYRILVPQSLDSISTRLKITQVYFPTFENRLQNVDVAGANSKMYLTAFFTIRNSLK